MRRSHLHRGAALMALLLIAIAAVAQRGRFFRRDDDEAQIPKRNGEFHFIRMEYADLPQHRRGWGFVSREGMGGGWWMQDWPAAENHFTTGLQRLTRIDAGDPRHFPLTDDRIFEYPWIYATQTGYWDLSDAETARLREYLNRGGFLMVDDFWYEDDWEVFRRTMERVLPNHPITDIALSDSVMHVLYDIQQKDLMFIPGSRHLQRGANGIEVVQPAGTASAWRAIYDDKNRMVVAVNFETDIGDAWEFADVPYYPEAMTTLAYRYGINYIIYSMTH